MIGWNHRASKIIELLDEFVEPGSELRVAAPRADPRSSIGELANLEVLFSEVDPTSRPALEGLEVGSFQHIVVLSDSGFDAQHADARTLVTLLHLRDMKEGPGESYSIVSEINDDANREVAQVTEADDFVVSEKLISLMMTQVSEDRYLYDVFADLLDPAGSEIYLKPVSGYLQPGATANFTTVIEAARRRGETALGYRLYEEYHLPPRYGVVLNPDKAARFTLSGKDRIIVLAEN
jgi:hypothetical protein